MSVNTAVRPFSFDKALPPFHLIRPSLNRFQKSIIRNRVTHTTTTSRSGSAPNKSKPLNDQYNSPHNHPTMKICEVLANRLNFLSSSASCPSSISKEITNPTLRVKTKLPASHHQSSDESFHSRSKAIRVQPNTNEVVAFTVACITYSGSRPSFKTDNPPINLTSKAESSTTPCAAAVMPPTDFNLADSTIPSESC